MKVDLDELERKARAATPGDWRWGRPADDGLVEHRRALFAPARGAPNIPVIVLDADSQYLTRADDTEHIAANGPPVTLALIARIRELESFITDTLSDEKYLDDAPALLEKGTTIP